MHIGLAIDKKNGVDNRTGKIKTDGKETDSNSGCYNMNNGKNTMKKEYEERIAQNKWQGWGTALKPSYEPIIVARKPCEGTCVDNVLKWGVGGINIDECRIPLEDGYEFKETNRQPKDGSVFNGESCGYDNTKNTTASASPLGRFPANTILTYDETDFDEVCGGFPYTKGCGNERFRTNNSVYSGKTSGGCMQSDVWGDEGSASRYFYCAKASKRDRDEGLDAFEEMGGIRSNAPRENEEIKTKPRKNIHPTVKPTTLCQYLVRLVTPKGGTVLDPFNGSGSTGKAVMYENKDRNADYKYIGIELTDDYLPISKARIEYACNNEVSKVIEVKQPQLEQPKKQTIKTASLW